MLRNNRINYIVNTTSLKDKLKLYKNDRNK